MGQKDIVEKKIEDYNDVFADIYNVLLFGKDLINPNGLEAGPTESIYKADKSELKNQYRDTLKKYKGGMGLVISALGVENQSAYDVTMPIRIMSYDAGSYKQQIIDGEETFYPVITIVLNFSNHEWGSVKSLYELLDISDEFRAYVQNYRIQVFDIAFLDDDVIEKFQSDFKVIARFFKNKRLGKSIEDETAVVHAEAFMEFLSIFADDKSYIDILPNIQKEGKVVNMCNVAQSLIAEGRGKERQELNCLYNILLMEGATDKMQKALSDDAYLDSLFEEYADKIQAEMSKKMVV